MALGDQGRHRSRRRVDPADQPGLSRFRIRCHGRTAQAAGKSGARWIENLPDHRRTVRTVHASTVGHVSGGQFSGQAAGEMQRVEAERVLVRAAKAIGRLVAAPTTASDGKDPPAAHGAESGDELYDRLYSASITLSIAWKLSQANGAAYTLTELEQSLGIRSRKRGYEALRALDQVGWINKGRHAGLTKYQLTDEGARQLQRLAAAADGPVRRAMLNGSTPL